MEGFPPFENAAELNSRFKALGEQLYIISLSRTTHSISVDSEKVAFSLLDADAGPYLMRMRTCSEMLHSSSSGNCTMGTSQLARTPSSPSAAQRSIN